MQDAEGKGWLHLVLRFSPYPVDSVALKCQL